MRYLIAILVAFAWLGPVSAGEIYCNQQGRDCSDRPSPGSVVVHVSSASRNAAATAASPSSRSATGGDPVLQQQIQNAAESKAKADLQKDLAEKRSEQCKKAQDFYRGTLEAQQIYRTDKDGERVYLSEEEANQTRLNARLDIAKVCGNGTG